MITSENILCNHTSHMPLLSLIEIRDHTTHHRSHKKTFHSKLSGPKCEVYCQTVTYNSPLLKADSRSEKKPLIPNYLSFFLVILQGQAGPGKQRLRRTAVIKSSYGSRAASRQTDFWGDCHCFPHNLKHVCGQNKEPDAHSTQSSFNLGLQEEFQEGSPVVSATLCKLLVSPCYCY